MRTPMIAAAMILALPLAAHAQGRARSAGAPSAPPRAAAPGPATGTAAASRTRAAADAGRLRSTPPARPATTVPSQSGWATGPTRQQGQRPPSGWSLHGSRPYVSHPYDSRPYQSRPIEPRHYGRYASPYVIVVPQPYAYVIDVDRRVDVDQERGAAAAPEAAVVPAPSGRAPGVRTIAAAAPLVVEPLAGALLRLRWVGTDTTVHEVTLLLADAQRRPLVSQTVHARPFTAVLERTARAAFVGVTVVHVDGASTTTLVPMQSVAGIRDR